jgi:hypothetical protein
MTRNNINTLTFDNHDTYIYYVDEVTKSSHLVTLIPTNPEDTDTVIYRSNETNLFTNGVNNGIIKFNDFIRSKLFNSIFNSTIITIITDDGILMANVVNELSSKILFNSGKQIKTLATYKSGKYENYINVEIQIDTEDTYRIVTISY